MMNSFKQSIPTFVELKEPTPLLKFNTTEELISILSDLGYGKRKDFSHYALSGDSVLELSDNGYYWWMVGSIEETDGIDLPEWDGGKHKVKLPL